MNMNWKQLIEDLLNIEGWHAARVARHIGVTRSSIHTILRSKQTDMRWHTGEKLRKLHAKETRGKDGI